MSTNEVVIHKTKLLGTSRVAYSAWEPSSYTGAHGTLMTIDGRVMGKVGTNHLPAELNALPAYSNERSLAVRAWIDSQKERAYAAIVAAVPAARDGARDGYGEIEVIERS